MKTAKYYLFIPLGLFTLAGCGPKKTECTNVACSANCTSHTNSDGCVDGCGCPAPSSSWAGVSSSSSHASSTAGASSAVSQSSGSHSGNLGSTSAPPASTSAGASSAVGSSLAASSSSANSQLASSTAGTSGTSNASSAVASSGSSANSAPQACGAVTLLEVANGGVGINILAGPNAPLGPVADASGGPVALVDLAFAGLAESPAVALMQSVGTGVRLLDLSSIDATFLGTTPAAVSGHVYSLGANAAWGTKAPGLIPLGAAVTGWDNATGLDALAYASPAVTAAGNNSQVFGLRLVQQPVASPPVLPTPVEANVFSGYPSAQLALSEGRYLHVRNDGTNSVDALDLLTPANSGFAPVAARTFSTSLVPGLPPHAVAALTPAVHPVTGDLAVGYTDLGAPGAGIVVFNPATLEWRHHRLASVGATEAQDITSMRWNPEGTQLWVTVDHYVPTGSFARLSGRVDVFDVATTGHALVDSDPATANVVEPRISMRLPLMRPMQTLFINVWLVAVATAPNTGESAVLFLSRSFDFCEADGLARAPLGTLVYDYPNMVKSPSQGYIFVGTQNGVVIIQPL